MIRRAGARRFLLYAIVAALGFLSAYLIVAFLVFPPQLVPDDRPVPNVVGLEYDEAARRVAAAGFKAAPGETRFSAVAPKNTVLAQTPPAGARDVGGATVTLDVSGGSRDVEVPVLVGLSQQQAEVAIEGAGLEIGDVTTRESEQARGQVLQADPAAGTSVAPSTPVTLVVSSGPAAVQVPDVIGRDLADARAMLEQIGLRAGQLSYDSTAVGYLRNTVLAQTPAAGANVRPGTAVSLRLAEIP